MTPPDLDTAPPPTIDLPWETPITGFSYLCGAAGTGKTTLIRAWAEADRGILLCATTGIAAVNIGAQTLNSTLGYFDTASLVEQYTTGRLTASLGKLWKAGTTRLIIDEISMLPAEQLTVLARAVDEVNGRGYVLDSRWEDEQTPPSLGLTLCGDFLQLPPVPDQDLAGKKKPVQFAFESPEWEKFLPNIKQLTEIRRQADRSFIEGLQAARKGDGAGALATFRSRLTPLMDENFAGSTLLAKNAQVDRLNQLRMDKLAGRLIRFESVRDGQQRPEWGNPRKPPAQWGIPKALDLKEGSLVMVLSNARDEFGRLIYVNGDLGTFLGPGDGGGAAVTLQRTGGTVEIAYQRRETLIPCDSVRRKELRAKNEAHKIKDKWEIAGTIDYMPLRLAYATTVHKSQGLSLDQVQVNFSDHFFSTPGMLYVALSRARTLEGLRLVGRAESFVSRCVVHPKLGGWL